MGPRAGASRGAVAGAVLAEAARGEPDDVGVYRDFNDGVAGAVICPAGAAVEHAGQGLIPGAGGELAQALPLARDPDAVAQGLVDGLGGVTGGGVDFMPRVAVQLGEVAALRLEDLGELADVELAGVGAGGRAGPEPVAGADGLVRRQEAGDGPGDAAAGGAAGSPEARLVRGIAHAWHRRKWGRVPCNSCVHPSRIGGIGSLESRA